MMDEIGAREQRLQQRIAELERLRKISLRLTSALAFTDVMQIVADSVCGIERQGFKDHAQEEADRPVFLMDEFVRDDIGDRRYRPDRFLAENSDADTDLRADRA